MEHTVYRGKFIRVTEDIIDGTLYERAYIRDSVTIFAVDDDKNLYFIREKRPHETPPERWKAVTGFLEEGETVEENANRELQEEIGKRAGEIRLLLSVRHSGTINLTQHFVLARKLENRKLPNPDGEDSILEIRTLSLKEAVAWSLDGRLARGGGGYGLLKLNYDVNAGLVRL
jgi:ADP-ribose pyrophosphatase YjhB (NUDIX family)